MINECTDCKNGADFHGGFRVFCLSTDLPPEEVCKYHPVGDGDAYDCDEFFDIGGARQFTGSQLREAEAYSKKEYGEVTYAGIREWCTRELGARQGEPVVVGDWEAL